MGHLLVIRSDPCAERRKLVEPFTSAVAWHERRARSFTCLRI